MITIKNKKHKYIFLAAILILELFSPIKGLLKVHASDVNVEIKEGIIKFETISSKAVSSIRYRTIGWTIHRDYASAQNPAQTGKPYAQVFMEQVEEDDLGTQVRTYFEVSEQKLNEALTKHGLDQIKSSETIYLSAIFEVRKYDAMGNYTILGLKQYDSLQAIKKAQSWSNPNDFEQYFNIAVPYKSSENHELRKEIRVNGSAISNEKLTTSESGMQHITTFDETITYQGKKYDLVRSYYKKNLDKMKECDIHVWPDSEIARRTDTMSAGGITVIGEYIPSVETEDETKPRPNPKVTVTTRHINVQTNSYVKPETVEKAEYGSSITKRAEAITGMIYIRSNYSTDNGITWKNKSQDSLTIDNIKDDVIINFYYSPQGEIAANLALRAAPSNIKQGQSEAVEFTLDASGSYCDEHTKIVKYEYWLQTDDNFGSNPDYTEASQIKTAFKYNVKPNSTYYGKVRITDGFGNTAEAVAEIYIGELYVEPAATAKADLQIVLAQNNYYTLSYEEFGSWVNGIGSHRYRMEIRIPEDYQYDLNGIWRDDDIGIDFVLDASRSTSTNGINPYHFIVPYPDMISTLGLGNKLNEQELQTSSATTNIFSHTFGWSIEDAYNGIPHRDMYDSEWAVDFFHLTITDSEDTKASDRISSYLIYRYVFDKASPDVKLEINRSEFAYSETGYFTPQIIENQNTHPVETAYWEISTMAGKVIENGFGLITSEYDMYLMEGEYKARQYITYKDADGCHQEKYAQADFKVVSSREPDVTIISDKESYTVPDTVRFTVEYFTDIGRTYLISDHEYTLKNHTGEVIERGEGTFPEEKFYDIDSSGGIYTAEQTIYWYEQGQRKSKTASCKFKVISPVPAADFHVSMKTSLEDTWVRIDNNEESGKQYRQIRIDLYPSAELNRLIGNPYEVQFSNKNTQIQITPLTESADASTIQTPVSGDMCITSGIAEINGKQYIDVRFDNYGVYKISVRVANQYYTSAWVSKEITIREDLPPIIRSMTLTGTSEDKGSGGHFVYRDDGLHASYGLIIDAAVQDDDILDYDSAKLFIRYDFNADGDVTNDGNYSEMYVTLNNSCLLDGFFNVTRDEEMSVFTFDMFSSVFPILGKVRFEYSILKTPVIPYFTSETMPVINIPAADSEHIAEYNKAVTVENYAGTIVVELEKESLLEIVIYMDADKLYFDMDTLITMYKDTAKIYIVDRNGVRTLVN